MSKAEDLPFMFSYSFLELLNADTFDVDVVMGSGVTHDNLQEVASSDCMIVHGTETPPLGSNGVDPQGKKLRMYRLKCERNKKEGNRLFIAIWNKEVLMVFCRLVVWKLNMLGANNMGCKRDNDETARVKPSPLRRGLLIEVLCLDVDNLD
ncbi:hypothetical protein Tco_0708641 [Tanacetum coccineum]